MGIFLFSFYKYTLVHYVREAHNTSPNKRSTQHIIDTLFNKTKGRLGQAIV